MKPDPERKRKNTKQTNFLFFFFFLRLTCILILSSSSTTENFSFTSFESVELPGWRKKKEKQKLNANLSYMVDNLFWINSTEN